MLFFLNEVLGLNTELLGGTPKFQWRSLKVVNPMAGTGKKRHIAMPNPYMRIVHRRFRNWIDGLDVEYTYATAFRKGDSARKNAEMHCISDVQDHFLLVDIHSAFSGVRLEKLVELLLPLDLRLQGHEQDLGDFLAEFCFTSQGGLITGAPASPALFNLYCALTIDSAIGEICAQSNTYAVFTRYGDDCTISSHTPITRKWRKAIYRVIRDAGFELNYKKTCVRILGRGPVIVTGVSIRYWRQMTVPKPFLRETEEMLQLAQQERRITPVFAGRIGAVIGAVGKYPDSRRERRLLESFRRLRRNVRAENRQR